jgi:Tfp pilus assembly protein PilZ
MGRCYRPSDPAMFSEKLAVPPVQDKRQYFRKRCFIEVDYTIRGYCYKGSIQNISEGGAYVRSNTARRFLWGEHVALIIPLRILGDQIKGKIAWVRPHGMGIMFEKSSAVSGELKTEPAEGSASEDKSRKTGKIRNRRIRWEPSTSHDVIRYRLYWSKKGTLGYDSDYADLENVTQINLPDDIPSFPRTAGEFELGISAMNRVGNESELAKAIVRFDFRLPAAPRNLTVDDE